MVLLAHSGPRAAPALLLALLAQAILLCRGTSCDNVFSAGEPVVCTGASCDVISISETQTGLWTVERSPYGNDESASLLLRGPGRVTFVNFDTEQCCDYLTLAGSSHSGNELPAPVDLPRGVHAVEWTSDGSSTRDGWRFQFQLLAEEAFDEVCPDGSLIPVGKTLAAGGTCTSCTRSECCHQTCGAFDCGSTHSVTNPHTVCASAMCTSEECCRPAACDEIFSAGEPVVCTGASCDVVSISETQTGLWTVERGPYGHHESASMLLQGPGRVTFVNLDTESGFDTLTLAGSSHSGSTLPALVDLPRGVHAVEWTSDGSSARDGWRFQFQLLAEDAFDDVCPEGFAIPVDKALAAGGTCTSCTSSECCRPTCGAFDCGSTHAVASRQALCAGATCTFEECCQRTCGTFTCAGGMVKTAQDDVLCSNPTCTASECCDDVLCRNPLPYCTASQCCADLRTLIEFETRNNEPRSSHPQAHMCIRSPNCTQFLDQLDPKAKAILERDGCCPFFQDGYSSRTGYLECCEAKEVNPIMLLVEDVLTDSTAPTVAAFSALAACACLAAFMRTHYWQHWWQQRRTWSEGWYPAVAPMLLCVCSPLAAIVLMQPREQRARGAGGARPAASDDAPAEPEEASGAQAPPPPASTATRPGVNVSAGVTLATFVYTFAANVFVARFVIFIRGGMEILVICLPTLIAVNLIPLILAARWNWTDEENRCVGIVAGYLSAYMLFAQMTISAAVVMSAIVLCPLLAAARFVQKRCRPDPHPGPEPVADQAFRWCILAASLKTLAEFVVQTVRMTINITLLRQSVLSLGSIFVLPDDLMQHLVGLPEIAVDVPVINGIGWISEAFDTLFYEVTKHAASPNTQCAEGIWLSNTSITAFALAVAWLVVALDLIGLLQSCVLAAQHRKPKREVWANIAQKLHDLLFLALQFCTFMGSYLGTTLGIVLMTPIWIFRESQQMAAQWERSPMLQGLLAEAAESNACDTSHASLVGLLMVAMLVALVGIGCFWLGINGRYTLWDQKLAERLLGLPEGPPVHRSPSGSACDAEGPRGRRSWCCCRRQAAGEGRAQKAGEDQSGFNFAWLPVSLGIWDERWNSRAFFIGERAEYYHHVLNALMRDAAEVENEEVKEAAGEGLDAAKGVKGAAEGVASAEGCHLSVEGPDAAEAAKEAAEESRNAKEFNELKDVGAVVLKEFNEINELKESLKESAAKVNSVLWLLFPGGAIVGKLGEYVNSPSVLELKDFGAYVRIPVFIKNATPNDKLKWLLSVSQFAGLMLLLFVPNPNTGIAILGGETALIVLKCGLSFYEHLVEVKEAAKKAKEAADKVKEGVDAVKAVKEAAEDVAAEEGKDPKARAASGDVGQRLDVATEGLDAVNNVKEAADDIAAEEGKDPKERAASGDISQRLDVATEVTV